MKTVKVRIAVAVDSSGNWSASGWKGASDDYAVSDVIDTVGECVSLFWVTAELPVPEMPTVAGTVEVAQ